MRANETYSEAKSQFSARNRDVLMNAPPRCRTSQYHRTFISSSVSLWIDLSYPVFDGMDWRVSRAGPMPVYWPSCSLTFCLLLFSISLLSFYGLVLWGSGLWTDRVLIALSQLSLPTFFNNNNNQGLTNSFLP